MKISQKVKEKMAEVIEIWAEETLEGKPAILANTTYWGICKYLQDKTAEINEKF